VYEAIEQGVPRRPVPIAHALGITRQAARHHPARLARLGAVRAVVVEVKRTEQRFAAHHDA
jgi:predicted ArsR family transcriptional regulator